MVDDDEDGKGTKNMGCGNTFKGGRCEDGSDTTDCLYDSPAALGADKCSGTLHLEKVPDTYQCKDQR